MNWLLDHYENDPEPEFPAPVSASAHVANGGTR